LSRYKNVEHLPWDRVEELLITLEDDEAVLLEKAIEFKKVEQHELHRLTAEVELLKQTVKSLSSQPSTTVSTLPEPVQTQESSSDREDDLPIDQIAEKFLQYKKGNVAAGSFTSYENKIRQFIQIVTEFNKNKTPTVSKLSPTIIRNYRDVLLKIPKNRNGISNKITHAEMIKMGLPPISQKTAKDTCNLVGEFLNYCEIEQYPITPALKTVLSSVKKPKSKDTQHRIPYSAEQLKLLFESIDYTQGKFKKPSEFWTPLIALFTGARLGEILQLHIGDIREAEGVWVFDLNDEGDKQLKSESSTRIVPIHSQLIDLGFLEFVTLRKQLKKDARLFPEEPRKTDGKFDNYSKRFRTYRNRVGITKDDDEMLDFHSFRHTIRTKMVEASVQESLIDDIIGHSSAGASIGKKVYTHSQLIPQKKEAIEKIIYEIDFTKIRPWNKSKLMQIMR
jgi:integrase